MILLAQRLLYPVKVMLTSQTSVSYQVRATACATIRAARSSGFRGPVSLAGSRGPTNFGTKPVEPFAAACSRVGALILYRSAGEGRRRWFSRWISIHHCSRASLFAIKVSGWSLPNALCRAWHACNTKYPFHGIPPSHRLANPKP